MKTYLLFVLCVAVFLLSACKQGEDEHELPPVKTVSEMRFDVSSVKGQTRGETIKSIDEVLSMGIFAYQTGAEDFDPATETHIPNLLYNQLAERPGEEEGGNNEWSYNPVAYWPLSLSVKNSFFAYSPHSSMFSEEANVRVSAVGESGYPTFRYTIPEDLTEQHDILYASPVLNINKETNNGKVLYNMKHALTWLAFVIAPTKYLHDDETYSVTWLSFMADRLPITSTLNLGTGAWSNTVYGPAMYEFELTAAAESIKPGQAARVVDPSSYLMLFPITIDGDESGATVDLTFTYDPGVEHRIDADPEEFYYFIQFPTTRMTAGNVVIYVINICADGISLSFLEENKIEDWLEANEDKEVEIF